MSDKQSKRLAAVGFAIKACAGGSQEARRVSQDINVIALVKGEERYVFLFDDAHRSEALRTLGRFASNPELSFSWYDAAVLSQRIRQTAAEVAQEQAAHAEHAAHPSPPAPHSKPRFALPKRRDTSADELG